MIEVTFADFKKWVQGSQIDLNKLVTCSMPQKIIKGRVLFTKRGCPFCHLAEDAVDRINMPLKERGHKPISIVNVTLFPWDRRFQKLQYLFNGVVQTPILLFEWDDRLIGAVGAHDTEEYLGFLEGLTGVVVR